MYPSGNCSRTQILAPAGTSASPSVNSVQPSPPSSILSPGFAVAFGAHSNVQGSKWQEGFAFKNLVAVLEVMLNSGSLSPHFGRRSSVGQTIFVALMVAVSGSSGTSGTHITLALSMNAP